MKRLLVLCSVAALCAAQPRNSADRALPRNALPEVLWRVPPKSTVQDWACGFGGCGEAPAPPFRFLLADVEGRSPKLMVEDARGRWWDIKFGAKAVPEVFGSRFVAAIGYAVEPSYYVRSGRLQNVGALKRAGRFVKPDGSFEPARFQLRDPRKLRFLKDHAWSLADNPFRGTHEFAGLRVVMMLLSNWDAKDLRDGVEEANTTVFETPGPGGRPELLYSFFDWGSTLGRWGGFMRRTRSDCSGFAADTSHFITGVQGHLVEWGYSGKHEQDVKDGITVEDLRWLAPYLAGITDADIRAGLQASGATPRQTTCWADALEARISQLERVASTGRFRR
jgi:hypothetical protein